jgi:hypothetical protein
MSEAPAKRYISTQQAAFIGVAAMVGAGIFSLLGAAGEVAGAAVWLSFLLAGGIAALQGYSFAKLGAKFPSAGGLLEYVNQGFGDGHIATVVAWLTYIANGIVTAMVALSFGSYASTAFAGDNAAWVKIFAVALLVTMTALNIAGSTLVARVQSLVVIVVIGSSTSFGSFLPLKCSSITSAVRRPRSVGICETVACIFPALMASMPRAPLACPLPLRARAIRSGRELLALVSISSIAMRYRLRPSGSPSNEIGIFPSHSSTSLATRAFISLSVITAR